MKIFKQQNQKQQVVFPDNVGIIVSEILRKSNLEETAEETFDKLTKNEPLRAEIILDIVEEVVISGSEKNFTALLQQKLNIPKQSVETLVKDIGEKLLPQIKKVSKEEAEKLAATEEIEEIQEEVPTEKEKSVIAERPVSPPSEEEPLQPSWKKAPRISKQPLQEPKKPERTTKTTEPDVYREPTE